MIGKSAGDMTTDETDSLPEKYAAAKNMQDEAVTTALQYKLHCEVKKYKKRSDGLTTSKLAIMSIAEYGIVEHDLKERRSNDDVSTDCLESCG